MSFYVLRTAIGDIPVGDGKEVEGNVTLAFNLRSCEFSLYREPESLAVLAEALAAMDNWPEATRYQEMAVEYASASAKKKHKRALHAVHRQGTTDRWPNGDERALRPARESEPETCSSFLAATNLPVRLRPFPPRLRLPAKISIAPAIAWIDPAGSPAS